MMHITKSGMEQRTIPLPPIEIQRQIVAEIEGYQKIIDGARQVVENWKPQIEIDPDWEMVKLGDVCEINPKKAEINTLDKNTLVSFMPMEDIGFELYLTPKKEKQIQEVFKGYTYFREKDVLVAKVTPCFENGKSGIAKNLTNQIGFGSSELHVIRPQKKLLSEFVYPFVTSEKFRNAGKTIMTGTGGLQRVPAFYIENLEIPLPSLEVQKEIVSKIETERKAVDSFRELIKTYEEKIKREIDKVWEE